MAFNTRERRKEKKGKEEEDGQPEDLTEELGIPEGLDSLPSEEQSTEESTPARPPTPVTMRGKTPRPARLPPKFKRQIRPQPTKEEGADLKTTTEEPQPKARTEDPWEEEADRTEKSSQTVPRVRPPVTRRRRRDPVPSPPQEEQPKSDRTEGTRPVVLPPEWEEKTAEDPRPAQQKTPTMTSVTRPPSTMTPSQLVRDQFDVSAILDRPKEQGWPWVLVDRVTIPQELQLSWRAEASLYAAISTLQFYASAYQAGELAPEVYSKRMKSTLTEAIQLRFKLESDERFEWQQFVEENQLDLFFPDAFEKLKRVEGRSDIDEAIDDETIELDYQEVKKLPTKAADFVGNAIELMDLIRLQSLATVERLIPLLEDLRKILQQTAKVFGADYWAIGEINAWVERLYKEQPGFIPDEKELERLEMQVVRWLNDFRRELKNL